MGRHMPIFLLTFGWFFAPIISSKTATAENIDFSNREVQARTVIGLGIGYLTYDIFQKKVTDNKTLAFLLSVATVVGGSVLFDQLAEKKFSSGNTVGTGVGVIGALFTHNLFSGDEAPKGYHLKNEQKQEQSFSPNIHIENKPQITVPEQRQPQNINLNVTIDGKGETPKSRESIKTFYPSPGREKTDETK